MLNYKGIHDNKCITLPHSVESRQQSMVSVFVLTLKDPMSESDRSFLELNTYKIKNSKPFRLESGQAYRRK